MKNQFKNKRAFTLIELLIVIAIIGILFVVLVSKIDFATDKAKATGVQTDFRAFQLAFNTVAQENAGFNTFGFNTGDNAGAIPSGYAFETEALKDATIGDGIRNSYDQGDKNLNGKQDTGEVFTGRKIYTETWTEVYTLAKPGTTGLDANAVFALESAINKNLDPKLHITIDNDGVITMANQARDPWKNEYHGVYISQAERDNGADRGAIIIYSNGANGKWGSAHDITNGVVSVTVPGNNTYGKDDYSIVSCYSYLNGYGQVINGTTGFSNNQIMPSGNGMIQNNNSNPEGGDDEELENDDSVTSIQAGLYQTGSNYENLLYTWDSLIEEGIIYYDDIDWSPTWEKEHLLEGDLVFPEGIEEFEYVSFSDNDTLTGVVLPNSLRAIGEYFVNCSKLEFNEYDNALYLGTIDNPYYACMFAKSLDITSVVIHKDTKIIAESAFYDCQNLSSVTLPDSLMYSIGEYAFDRTAVTFNQYENGLYMGNDSNPYLYLVSTVNKNITELNVHPQTKVIGGGAACDCMSLSKVVLPEGLLYIGKWGFAWSENIVELNVPSTVKMIGYCAFETLTNLSEITLPNGITTISAELLNGCESLERIIIPNSVTRIEAYSFVHGGNLQEVILSNQLTYIGGSAFWRCGFSEIRIPASVKQIEWQAFDSCRNLQTIIFEGTVEQWNSIILGDQWNRDVPATYVQCSDGQVAI